jgi:hypothetical protein
MSCWNGTLASSSNCCEPGMMWDGEVGSACVSCVAGRYDHDSSPHTSCKGCDAGFYSGRVGATSCTVCPLGRFSEGGLAECTSCAPGTYDSRSVEDLMSCADDPDWIGQHGGCETYAPSRTNAAYCESDGAMEACPVACGVCILPAIECESCAAGFFSAGTSTSCTECALGKSSPERSGQCTVCSPGSFDPRRPPPLPTSTEHCAQDDPNWSQYRSSGYHEGVYHYGGTRD